MAVHYEGSGLDAIVKVAGSRRPQGYETFTVSGKTSPNGGPRVAIALAPEIATAKWGIASLVNTAYRHSSSLVKLSLAVVD